MSRQPAARRVRTCREWQEPAAGNRESAGMRGTAGIARAGQEKEGQEPGSQGRGVWEKAETHTWRVSGQEPAME